MYVCIYINFIETYLLINFSFHFGLKATFALSSIRYIYFLDYLFIYYYYY